MIVFKKRKFYDILQTVVHLNFSFSVKKDLPLYSQQERMFLMQRFPMALVQGFPMVLMQGFLMVLFLNKLPQLYTLMIFRMISKRLLSILMIILSTENFICH